MRKSRKRSSQAHRQRIKKITERDGLTRRQAAEPPPPFHITRVSDPTTLYVRHPGQLQPEPVYVFVDVDERRIWMAHSIDGAIPSEWWQNHIHRFRIPTPPLSPRAANALMQSLNDDAVNMAAGYADGRLNHAAQRTRDDLKRAVDALTASDDDLVGAWDYDTAMGGVTLREAYEIAADTTDAELERIEEQVKADLGPDSFPEWNIQVWDGLWEDLVRARDALAADEGDG